MSAGVLRGVWFALGKVVGFGRRRPWGVDAGAVLDRVTRYYQDQVQAREALPATLAALVRAGRNEAAIAAIVAWGESGADPVELLADCRRVLSP